MIGFELLRPELVWLLLLVPLGLLLGWYGLARRRAELGRWVSERMRTRFLPGYSRSRATLRVALGASALGFLALAAAGPVRGYTYRSISRTGLDLVVCIDTSRSMLAQDLRPSRLERARREIVGLLDLLRGDRVALVAFSGGAREVAPLTRDKRTLEGLLSYVSPEDNQKGGTDLAAAIEHSLALFDGRTGAHEAIILLTDGEDLAGRAAAQVEQAVERGIRIFVVGIGTEAGGKIPVLDAAGKAAFLRDPEGEEVVTRLDGSSLASLARATGGEYLSAEQSPTPLEDLYRARITRIQGRELEGGERRVPYDRFQWPLALGLACLVLELGLRERVGRRDEPARSPRLAACLPLLLFIGGDDGARVDPLARALELHRKGELVAAEEVVRMILGGGDGAAQPDSVTQPDGAGKPEAVALDERARARVEFALGVIAATRALEEDEDEAFLAARTSAGEAFATARALAGPGTLREDATYDLGALELLHAERVRARIPEVAQRNPGMAPAPPPAPAGADGEAPADPLPEARALYQAARTWLVERLRLDWRDADTRADLELIQRRLRELDEIEEQREQQEQEQQDQQQDPDQEGEPDPDQEPQDGEDQDQQQDPSEGDQQQDPQDPDQQQEQEEQEQEEEQPGDEEQQQPEPEEGQQGQAQEEEPAERVLTREEVMQLLDKLAEIEKEQRALEAAMRAKRRKKTARDW